MKHECPKSQEAQEACKYYPNCSGSTHHLFYPKPDYRPGVERRFRELPENKEYDVCRADHDTIHFTQEPPPKPNLQFMIEALRNHGSPECP
jgi:hypothetical protein